MGNTAQAAGTVLKSSFVILSWGSIWTYLTFGLALPRSNKPSPMCVTAVNFILFDSRAYTELFCWPTWNTLSVYNSDLMVGYGGEISYTQNRVVYKNEHIHFMLQEPVKRNPTHAQFHPALSFMLLCCNHLAITLCVSPSLLLDTKAGRKHEEAREQRTELLDLAGQPKEAVSGFPLTIAGMWSRELRGPTMGHMCDDECQGLISFIPTDVNIN